MDPALGSEWRRAPEQPAFDPPASIHGVAATQDGFVAVGRGGCLGEEELACRAAAWTSSDGVTWRRAEHTDALELGGAIPISGPEPGMEGVTAGDAGLVAFGYTGFEEIVPAIWVSEDGTRWDRLPEDPDFRGARFADITAGGPGYVIVGTVVGGPEPRAAVWYSSDGRSWRRAPDRAAFDVGGYFDTGEEPESGGMNAVAPGGAGLVAVGESCNEQGGACRGAAWTSRDGIRWARAQDLPGLETSMRALAVLRGELVAVGSSCAGSCRPLTWTSDDGVTWARHRGPAGTDGFEFAAATGGRIVSVGLSSDASTTFWFSDTGAQWRRARLPPSPGGGPPFVTGLTASTDRFVAVGNQESGLEEPRVFVLVSPP